MKYIFIILAAVFLQLFIQHIGDEAALTLLLTVILCTGFFCVLHKLDKK